MNQYSLLTSRRGGWGRGQNGGSDALEESEKRSEGADTDPDSEEEEWSFVSQEKTRLINEDGSNIAQYTERPVPEKELPYPFHVVFIIGNEFCERFSYYGLRTVLVLYFSSKLLMTEDASTSLFHGWTFLCYFTPIFGATIADSYLGKFRTIFMLSIVYLLGNVVLSLAAIPPFVPNIKTEKFLSIVGLILIAFGMGGIKPCVSAFGGEQFVLPQQERHLSKFFSIFYFSINSGSFLSTLVTPVFREDVSCYGGDCFALAFGVPALLMFIALVFFALGSSGYKRVPPVGNVAWEVLKCISYAGYMNIRTKLFTRPLKEPFCDDVIKKKPAPHWLHLAEARFTSTLVRDIKILLRVLVLYLPLPFFWALYDQQGSRWTFQAAKMSGNIGLWTIKPDQMQVLNPLLVLMLIPVFDSMVYPLLTSLGILKKPLHRMLTGGLLACLAFVVSGLLQGAIENTETRSGENGLLSLRVLNDLPCKLKFRILDMPQHDIIRDYDMLMKEIDVTLFLGSQNMTSARGSSPAFKVDFSVLDPSGHCTSIMPHNLVSQIPIRSRQEELILVVTSYLGRATIVEPKLKNRSKEPLPTKEETSYVRVFDSSDQLRLSPLKVTHMNRTELLHSQFYSKGISFTSTNLTPGQSYEIGIASVSGGTGGDVPLGAFTAPFSSSSFLFIRRVQADGSLLLKSFQSEVLSIHMLWQVPQYLLMSVGEVMFSITGLEFSFTQAPSSMKSVVQAAWLLNNAFGNLYVVLIAESKLVSDQSTEFFLFAALMLLDMLIFYYLARKFHGLSEGKEEALDNSTLNLDQEDVPAVSVFEGGSVVEANGSLPSSQARRLALKKGEDLTQL